MDEPFVVKVQRPIGGHNPERCYLIYPEDGSWNLMWPMGDQPMLDEAMKFIPKKYFWARLDDQGRLEILVKLPCEQSQTW